MLRPSSLTKWTSRRPFLPQRQGKKRTIGGRADLIELSPHHNRRVLYETPLPLVVLERPCATQVLAGILFDQTPHLRRTLSRRLGVGHPAFDHLVQMTRGDMLKL